jgi:hypothetical protein
MDDDGPVVAGSEAQHPLEPGYVVAVDRTDVAHAQRLEEPARIQHGIPQACSYAIHPAIEVLADERHVPQRPLDPLPALHIGRADPHAGQAGSEPADRRSIRPAVVVEDDQDPALAVTQVVERLVGHAPGHRAVAHDRDDPPLAPMP